MKFNTTKEIQEYLYDELGLKNHSIIFHILDDGLLYFGSGMVESSDDLHDSDAFEDLCYSSDDKGETVTVFEATTWMIGDGESESAWPSELEVLENLRRDNRRLFFEYLDEYADCLANLYDLEAENPYYNPEQDEDDEEEGEW